MAVDKAKLLATREDALAAKRAFEKAFGADLMNCAVGLTPSRDGQNWALKVYVQGQATGPDLPSVYDDLEVDVELTGPVSAH